MLDSHQLNVFLTAAETLNFTKAAKRLHMTQPSVSQHIQSLERHFGMPLFIRAGRHLELTDVGMTLVPLARDLVRKSQYIEEMMESMRGEVHGHLRVGCSTTPGKYVLPQILAHLHREHPKVSVTCQVSSQETAIQMLCDGEVQVALTSVPLSMPKDTEFKKFMTDPVVLIAPLDHPWAKRVSIQPKDLYEADFILREEESGTQIAVKKALKKVGIDISDLQNILTLGNSEAISMAVQQGLGVGFVSMLVVDRLVQEQVAIIEVQGVDISRDIFIARHSRYPATMAMKAFWELINNPETLELPHLLVEQEPVFA